MKILIIEDQEEKAHVLKNLVLGICPLAEVTVAVTARDGYVHIVSNKYDLVLLDVVVPLGGNDAPAEEASLWFVREVNRKPPAGGAPLILGVTQFADSLTRVQEVFRDYLWNVIHFSQDELGWQSKVARAIQFAESKVVQLDIAPEFSFDVAVVTALRTPEFSEFLDVLGDCKPLRLTGTNENWVTKVVKTQDGREVSVLGACANEMGMTAMASLVTKIGLFTNTPRMLLIGITAGNRERVGLSDLLMVESSWDSNAGKLTENGFSADVKSRQCDFALANGFMNIVDEDFLMKFWRDWKWAKPNGIAALKRGDVACSSAVVADGEMFKVLEDQRRKVLGLEMEAFGFYDAARRLGGRAPRVLCVKSVCDFADGGKTDQFQQYCSSLVSAATMRVITDGSFLTL